jgi:phosphatidate cytidylyltransferase
VASSLKREANIKDFSRTLPGMGGILDRFDGLLFIVPVFYAFVRLSIKI